MAHFLFAGLLAGAADGHASSELVNEQQLGRLPRTAMPATAVSARPATASCGLWLRVHRAHRRWKRCPETSAESAMRPRPGQAGHRGSSYWLRGSGRAAGRRGVAPPSGW